MGRILFYSLQPWGWYFLPLPWSQWEDIYRKNAVAAIFLNEIADSDWNAVAPIEVNWKKKNQTLRAASTANTVMSRNIFWRQYLWKEYDLPQYKIFCLIVCGKNERMSWGQVFFSCCQPRGIFFFFFFYRFLLCGIFFFIRQFTFAPAPCPNKYYLIP